MQFRFRRALCLLLMLFLMLSAMPTSFAEDTADVAVHSAPLERSTATRNGMVRVRLLSIGSNPASLTVTAVGAMAVIAFTTAIMSSFDAVDFILVKVLVFIILSPFTSAPWSSFIFTEVAFGVEITAIILPPFLFLIYIINQKTYM